MAKLCRIEHAIGEDRAAVIYHKRDIEYYISRWSKRHLARQGEVFSGRITHIDKEIMAAFVDLGNGESGLLRFSMATNAPRLVEGAMIRVEVLREAEPGKGPLLRYMAMSQSKACVREEAKSLRDTIAARYPGIQFEEGRVNGIDEAAEVEIALQGGGYIYIEHTRAGTMIDLDTGNAKKSTAGITAAREISKQIRKRGIGGLIIIDFPSFRQKKVQADVWQTLVDGFADDPDRPKFAKFSRFGVVEMTRARKSASIAQVMMDSCGRPTDETQALRALRRLTDEARIDGGAQLVLQVPKSVFDWLQSGFIGWEEALRERIGARYHIVTGKDIQVYRDDHD